MWEVRKNCVLFGHTILKNVKGWSTWSTALTNNELILLRKNWKEYSPIQTWRTAWFWFWPTKGTSQQWVSNTSAKNSNCKVSKGTGPCTLFAPSSRKGTTWVSQCSGSSKTSTISKTPKRLSIWESDPL